MLPIEGELVVRVTTSRGRVDAIEARTERPQVAPRLMPGRLASEAPRLLAALFAVCGRSQAVAARSAVEAANGHDVASGERLLRERRIAAETLQEAAWRFLVDYPRLIGGTPRVPALAEARRVLAPLLDGDEAAAFPAIDPIRRWSRAAFFGVEAEAFLAIPGIDELVEWTRMAGTPVASDAAAWLGHEPGLGASAVALLPVGDDAWVGREMPAAMASDAAFELAPARQGTPAETGALARMASHPLVADATARWGRGVAARYVARLVEAAHLVATLEAPRQPRHGATPIAKGSAIGWVETARGLLMHRVALDGERVADWRIVAPTEWNFHPDGAFVHGALKVEGGDEQVLGRVKRLAASLDPCVAMRCEITHA